MLTFGKIFRILQNEEAIKMLASDIRDDYEIIEGVKFMAPAPTAKHSSLVGRLITVFNCYIDEKRFH